MKLRPLTHPLSLALACVGLAVVADLLFWKAQGLGWTPAGMLAALTAAAALRPSCRGNSATKAVFLAERAKET